MKVTIIGTGSVGSTIAYTMTVMGLAAEIVMIDVNTEKAMGEALDIRQGVPFFAPCSVYAGSYRDAENSDIVVITSGIARKPGQSRLDLAQTNVNIMKSILPEITKHAPDAKYIIVSNPVDILTYVLFKRSGLPAQNIIGSGTVLDTARLRARLSEYYNISQKNVHAYVLGEHGDSSFVPWSSANISNVSVEDFASNAAAFNFAVPSLETDEVEKYVRTSGAKVIGRKGATFFAVSASVCYIAQALQSTINSTLTVSTLLNGEYGINDCCLSLPCVVSKDGVGGKIHLNLTDDEVVKLKNSEQCLKTIMNQLEI